jgi:hypothetical protein
MEFIEESGLNYSGWVRDQLDEYRARVALGRRAQLEREIAQKQDNIADKETELKVLREELKGLQTELAEYEQNEDKEYEAVFNALENLGNLHPDFWRPGYDIVKERALELGMKSSELLDLADEIDLRSTARVTEQDGVVAEDCREDLIDTTWDGELSEDQKQAVREWVDVEF